MENEIWKPVKNYNGYYEVSNLGRVKSIRRDVKMSNNRIYRVQERILKQYVDYYGYATVALSVDCKVKTKKIHKLVAESFLHHEPCGLEIVVDHIDNDKSNNKLSNLQLITQRENSNKDVVNKSGIVGVRLIEKTGKWKATITINGKIVHLGHFSDKESARIARENAFKKVTNEQRTIPRPPRN
jgi:hypothetical protein